MKKIQITSQSAEEIEELIKSKEDYKIAYRLISILPLAKGKSSREAAKLLTLSHNQILIWAKRFEKEGIEGLKDKPHSGRKSRINEEQLMALKAIILNQSPENYGYNTAVWTLPLIVEIVNIKFELTYSDEAIRLILRDKLGLSHTKSRGYYLEKNAERRKNFI